ncbi:MAG: ATP-binding cassette domain-containing protein [Gaiellaceae bacterium]
MLTFDGVTKVFTLGTFGGQQLTAVRNVSFEVKSGEVVSLIGESGSGKSTIGKMILRLSPITKGVIRFDGVDISTISRWKLKDYYRRVQGVFQDPFSSYNPVFKADRVFAMIKNEYFPGVSGPEWRNKLGLALEAVTLDPTQVLNKYPHQLSGGQLQRLLIARALLLNIEFLVADEIISMLDASTRIDVLNLLADLKARGLGIMFITHDLSLGNYISDKTVILRRGLIVEMGATPKVFGNPTHPYTKMLLASVPQLHHKWDEVAKALKVSEDQLIDPDAAKRAYESVGEILAPDAVDSVLVETESDHLVRFSPEEAKGKKKSPVRKRA